MHIKIQDVSAHCALVHCEDAAGTFGAILTTQPEFIPDWIEKLTSVNRLAALRNAGLSGMIFFHKKWMKIELTPVGKHEINGHVINRLPIQ